MVIGSNLILISRHLHLPRIHEQKALMILKMTVHFYLIFLYPRLYTTLLTTLTILLDSIESTLSDTRARIKPDEVSSTYFKMAKKQMDATKVCQRIPIYSQDLEEEYIKTFFCSGNGS